APPRAPRGGDPPPRGGRSKGGEAQTADVFRRPRHIRETAAGNGDIGTARVRGVVRLTRRRVIGRREGEGAGVCVPDKEEYRQDSTDKNALHAPSLHSRSSVPSQDSAGARIFWGTGETK